ncbi:hypothetical protein U9M48_001335 [Paspalum notatum var. saurae]|uniref:Fungal lipase-type domain-containing protein n=1 Tax=Paspalum notatum var. saurae TaxID=547442 RepID=A0AAQ3PI53_PASNO
MGAKGAAAASAAAAALAYAALSGRLSSGGGGDAARQQRHRRRAEEEGDEEERWPERAPAGWRQALAVAARTAGFAYAETLGKWPLGDIAFGITHHMRAQGSLQHEYAGGSDCVALGGPGVRRDLIGLLRHLRLCMFFSKKPYQVFLELGGYAQGDILIAKPKSKLMKPAFTAVRDESTRCFLLFIRGATSAKDRLTAAAAAEVPFRHSVFRDGHGHGHGRKPSVVVSGHAHCGMVAAARWIADQAVPCLSRALEQFPDYRVKIIGHSMGAGIAAILTYMLREDNRLSSSSCIAFGPAACMTWDLAESGKDFVTTVVNRNDLVPSLGKASAANLRTEVMASSWAPELRQQIQQTRILGFVNCSVDFMRSRIPFVSSAGSKVADANMLMSDDTPLDELKLSANVRTAVRTHSALSCWSPAAPNRQTLDSLVNATQGVPALMSTYSGTDQNTEKPTTPVGEATSCSPEEPDRQRPDAAETDQEENQEQIEQQLLKALRPSSIASQDQEPHQLYPPGRIMHMVVLPAQEEPSTGERRHQNEEVAIYHTPRSMYGKIRLDRSMIRDHYMPRYIETMEMLIDKLAEDVDDRDN